MKCLGILNGELKIPLAIISGISYGKAANLVETHKNIFRCKGFGCKSISVSFSVQSNVMPLFYELNPAMAQSAGNSVGWSFADLVKYLIALKPDINTKPFHVYLADNCICPELLFAITSTTQTMQSDFNGRVMQCDFSMTLSGCACSKESSRETEVSYDNLSEMPSVTLHVGENSIRFAEDISMSRFVMTPTELQIDAILATSYKEKSAYAWVFTPAQSQSSFIDVDGFGRFYIKNSQWDGDILSFECSRFSKKSEEIITKTFMDTTLDSVISALELPVRISSKTALKDTNIAHIFIRENSIDALRILRDNLGFMTAITEQEIVCYDLPDRLPRKDVIDINYFIDDDIVSSKTTRVIVRDGIHEYISGVKTEDGAEVLINSPIFSYTDRSSMILKKTRFNENAIEINIPYNPQIKHNSIVSVNYDKRVIMCIVSDYEIDFLSNNMRILLNYLER